ncbi:lymphocyte antigen 6K [Sigmodon hispidus]
MDLPLVQTQDGLTCHVCEIENSLNCENPQQCPPDEEFCVLAVTQIMARFYLTSKQCSRTCMVTEMLPPVSDDNEPPQPQSYLAEKPLPFSSARCCKWNLCNQFVPETPTVQEQPGKASEKRHRYTELFLTGFMVLTATGLTDLILL